MSKKTRKSYRKEFKEQAIELAKELGNRKAAEKLGILSHQTLAAWVRRDQKMSSDEEFRLSENLKAENKKLKKELDEANKIIAILKDATTFFCEEAKK